MSPEDSDNPGPFRDRILVPKFFHSVERGEPFSHCLDCERFLLGDGQPYMIEKAFRGEETVYEYALCLGCTFALLSSLSTESMQAIDRFYDERVDLGARRQNLRREFGTDVEAWVRLCVLCSTPRLECTEYQAFGWCHGPDLVFRDHPLFVCGACVDQLVEHLSKKTIGELERWSEENLAPPPYIRDLLGGPVVKRI